MGVTSTLARRFSIARLRGVRGDPLGWFGDTGVGGDEDSNDRLGLGDSVTCPPLFVASVLGLLGSWGERGVEGFSVRRGRSCGDCGIEGIVPPGVRGVTDGGMIVRPDKSGLVVGGKEKRCGGCLWLLTRLGWESSLWLNGTEFSAVGWDFACDAVKWVDGDRIMDSRPRGRLFVMVVAKFEKRSIALPKTCEHVWDQRSVG